MKYILLLVVFSFVGCGGSDSGGGGDSGTGSSTTPITFTAAGEVDSVSEQLGQFSVNGYTISANGNSLKYTDEVYPLSTLENGMNVRVVVENDELISIELLPIWVGFVDDVIGSSIEVNGVVFDLSGEALSVGDWVMVFGHTLPDLSYAVTNISSVRNSNFAELEGQITNIDTVNQTLVISGVSIDFSNSVIDGNGPLEVGMWAEVYGEYNSNVFTAVKVDPRDDDDVSGTEVEGVITWVNEDKSGFEIAGGIAIKVTPSTLFDDGSLADLVAGQLVEVTLSHSMEAMKVDFESAFSFDDDNLEYSIEGEASFSNGIVTINGFEFVTDNTTQYDDGANPNVLNGAWLEVKGKVLQGSNWVKEIKLEDKDNKIDLKGMVSAGTLWGYSASDNSLKAFEGQWLDVYCVRSINNTLSQCQLDLD